jgi:hypothetical protein
MVVVFLFLRSFRRTLVIGTSIPIAILGCVALMGTADLTLNIMSLGGLALGIGMLVDNAIVMLENIDRHQREHPDPVEAAHTGAGEVASAVTASTLTNLAAVVPFLLISGLASLLFSVLLITISFATAISLVVALTLVPMLAAAVAVAAAGRRQAPVLPRAVAALEGAYRRLAACAAAGWWWGPWPPAPPASPRLPPRQRFLPPAASRSAWVTMPPETPPRSPTSRAGHRAGGARPAKVRHVFAAAAGGVWGATPLQSHPLLAQRRARAAPRQA